MKKAKAIAKRQRYGRSPSKCPYCKSSNINAGAGHWECRNCGNEGSY